VKADHRLTFRIQLKKSLNPLLINGDFVIVSNMLRSIVRLPREQAFFIGYECTARQAKRGLCSTIHPLFWHLFTGAAGQLAMRLFQGARFLGRAGELVSQRTAVRRHCRRIASWAGTTVGERHFLVPCGFGIVARRFLGEIVSYPLVVSGCRGIGDARRYLAGWGY
jgi:hypothetical protein